MLLLWLVWLLLLTSILAYETKVNTSPSKEATDNLDRYMTDRILKEVYFRFYSRDFEGFKGLSVEASNISQSGIGPQKPIVVVVHGYSVNGFGGYSIGMKDAYLTYEDCNVIVVDWGSLAHDNIIVSRLSTFYIAVYIARLMDELVNVLHISLDNVHILGHSMGAHVSGLVSGYLRTNGQIGRVTALDPANPLYLTSKSCVVSPDSAKFVDAIHTSMVGIALQVGHADFVPNGDMYFQPACGLDAVCAHSLAYEYYFESLDPNTKGFYARYCPTWIMYKLGLCKKEKPVLMGVKCPASARGVYFLRTAKTKPYAIGDEFED